MADEDEQQHSQRAVLSVLTQNIADVGEYEVGLVFTFYDEDGITELANKSCSIDLTVE